MSRIVHSHQNMAVVNPSNPKRGVQVLQAADHLSACDACFAASTPANPRLQGGGKHNTCGTTRALMCTTREAWMSDAAGAEDGCKRRGASESASDAPSNGMQTGTRQGTNLNAVLKHQACGRWCQNGRLRCTEIVAHQAGSMAGVRRRTSEGTTGRDVLPMWSSPGAGVSRCTSMTEGSGSIDTQHEG